LATLAARCFFELLQSDLTTPIAFDSTDAKGLRAVFYPRANRECHFNEYTVWPSP